MFFWGRLWRIAFQSRQLSVGEEKTPTNSVHLESSRKGRRSPPVPTSSAAGGERQSRRRHSPSGIHFKCDRLAACGCGATVPPVCTSWPAGVVWLQCDLREASVGTFFSCPDECTSNGVGLCRHRTAMRIIVSVQMHFQWGPSFADTGRQCEANQLLGDRARQRTRNRNVQPHDVFSAYVVPGCFGMPLCSQLVLQCSGREACFWSKLCSRRRSS